MPLKGNAEPAPCPSEQAYRRHLYHGEEPCEGCRQAHRDHSRDERPAATRFLQPECGTPAGYRWHRKNGEPACQPCKDALAEYARSRHRTATGTQPGRELAPCGTNAAYQRHQKHNEEPCAACKAEHSRFTAVDNKVRRVLAAMEREVES